MGVDWGGCGAERRRSVGFRCVGVVDGMWTRGGKVGLRCMHIHQKHATSTDLAVVPVERPVVAVGVHGLRGVDLGEHVVGGDAELEPALDHGLDVQQVALRGGRRRRQHRLRLGQARAEEERPVRRQHAHLQLEAPPDVRLLRAVAPLRRHLLPVVLARVRRQVVQRRRGRRLILPLRQRRRRVGGRVRAGRPVRPAAGRPLPRLVDALVRAPRVLEALERAENAVVPGQAELGAHHALDEEGAALARELW